MNQVSLIGRLTRDPELRQNGDTTVCTIRLAVNGRKDTKATFIDVVSFGASAEAVNEHLSKGRQVAVSGRLDYSEWTDKEGGKHSKHQVIGQVEFLGKA